MLIYTSKVRINVDIRRVFARQSCRRSLSSAAGDCAINQDLEGIQAIKIRFSNTAKRAFSRSFLPRAEYRSSRSLSLSHSPSDPIVYRPDAAANKKGRKVIEKVEQPRSLACTCRGACWLYRRARPRHGGTATNISACFSLAREIPILLLTKAISRPPACSNIVFQYATPREKVILNKITGVLFSSINLPINL